MLVKSEDPLPFTFPPQRSARETKGFLRKTYKGYHSQYQPWKLQIIFFSLANCSINKKQETIGSSLIISQCCLDLCFSYICIQTWAWLRQEYFCQIVACINMCLSKKSQHTLVIKVLDYMRVSHWSPFSFRRSSLGVLSLIGGGREESAIYTTGCLKESN